MKCKLKETKALEEYINGDRSGVKFTPVAVKEVFVRSFGWKTPGQYFDGFNTYGGHVELKNFWDIYKLDERVEKISFVMVTEFGEIYNGVDFDILEI
jgi:hypothetical protein